MDPFRDELAAAHAKIAQLEEELQKLKADPFRPSPAIDIERIRARQRSLLVVLGVATALVLLGALVAGVFVISRAPAPSTATASPAFSGIAIAPTAKSDNAPTATSLSPAVDKQDPHAGEKKPCNCTPGDPLCSCL